MRWAAIRPDRNAMGGNRAGTCPILRFSHLAFPYSSPVATVWIFQCKIHEYYHNVYKYTVGRAGGRQIRWGNIRMCGGGGVGGVSGSVVAVANIPLSPTPHFGVFIAI